MNKLTALIVLSLLFSTQLNAQSYNQMAIPDTLAGYVDTINHTNKKTYNLLMQEGTKYFFDTVHPTLTSGFSIFSFNPDSPYNYIVRNHNTFLGPTLLMNLGDQVQMNVINLLNDSSTVHWHGIHLPSIMDGGPHQVIPHGTIWQPYWTVADSAATYWYHPHLHNMTQTQVMQGLAGLIIVRTPTEAALALPRTYSVDDIPVIFTDRSFINGYQINLNVKLGLGDTVLTNGTFNAQYPVPRQVVRFRFLNGSISMLYNLGFRKPDGTNVPMHVIASDGGLLNAPALADTYLMAPGQRVELLVDLSGFSAGDTINLVSYNNVLDSFQSGGQNYPNTALAAQIFKVLHLIIGPQTTATAPVTTIPASLAKNQYPVGPVPSQDSILKVFEFGYPINMPPVPPDSFGFLINNRQFDMGFPGIGRMGTINDTVPLNSTQIWTIKNSWNSNTVFGGNGENHVFHIHDIQFHILGRTDTFGNTIPLSISDSGWKDDVSFSVNSSVTFITQFEDFSDPYWPYMYHCHMLEHEDGGMMGQFVVSGSAADVKNIVPRPEPVVKVFPNPATDKIYIELEDKTTYAYYATIFDNVGRTKYMLPKPDAQDGINISTLKPGDYFITIRDSKGNSTTKKFIKL